jgi:hypothetical protein
MTRIAGAHVAARTGDGTMARDRWRPTRYLLTSLTLPAVMLLVEVVLYLVTGGPRTRNVVIHGAVLVAVFAAAGAGVAFLFRGLWRSQRRTAPRLGDDELDAVEAALVEAGYEPAWGTSLVTYDNYQSLQVREGTYVTFAKMRDWSGGDCTHIFVGPVREDNRRDVEVAKRLVDRVVDRSERAREG